MPRPNTRTPDTPRWTLDATAELLGLSYSTLIRLLRSAAFPVKRYGRDGRHPRRRRLLTDAEVAKLSRLYQRVGIKTVKAETARRP